MVKYVEVRVTVFWKSKIQFINIFWLFIPSIRRTAIHFFQYYSYYQKISILIKNFEISFRRYLHSTFFLLFHFFFFSFPREKSTHIIFKKLKKFFNSDLLSNTTQDKMKYEKLFYKKKSFYSIWNQTRKFEIYKNLRRK